MRFRWVAILSALFAFTGVTNVQAQQGKAEPTIEVRLRSVDDLINKAEYITGLAGQDEIVKQFRQIIKQLSTAGKGLQGIDTKQPIGIYVSLTSDVVNSPITVMIPVADKDSLLKLLKDRLDITPEKADDGTLKAAVPIINEVYLRFANDYLYVARSVKDLDPKTLPTPKAFFGKDDGSVGSLLVRFDKIPAELKTFIVGQLELGIAEQRRKNGEKEAPPEKVLLDWVADNITGGVKTLLDDAKDLNIRVFIDEKADDLSAELTLTAKSGSTLSKNIRSLAGKTSLPAAIVGNKDIVGRLTAKGSLPDGVKKDLDKVVDSAIEEILKKTPDNDKPPVERILNTIAPTLKAGELDAAFALTGPDTKGNHALVAAAGVKKGKDIEKLLKDFAPHLGQIADFDFDVDTVGAFALHKITFKELPEKIEKVFGTKRLWVAISDDYVVLSIEPEGSAIRAGLKAKPVAVPVLEVEVSFAKLLTIVAPDLKADEVKALIKDAFGNASPAGNDTLHITVTGGEQLTVKGQLKGKSVRLFVGLKQLRAP
jgi:hypothetical protein